MRSCSAYNLASDLQEQTSKLLGLNAERPSQDHETEDPASNKRKRDADDDANDAPKILRPSETNGEFAVELSHSRQARVSSFKGQLYVNIREWYEKDGSQAPGKGISLQVPLWNDLTANLDAIATAISDEDTDYVCKLTKNRQVSVKQFKGKLQVSKTASFIYVAVCAEPYGKHCASLAELTNSMQCIRCALCISKVIQVKTKLCESQKFIYTAMSAGLCTRSCAVYMS